MRKITKEKNAAEYIAAEDDFRDKKRKGNGQDRKNNLQQIGEMLQILPDNEIERLKAYIKGIYFD